MIPCAKCGKDISPSLKWDPFCFACHDPALTEVDTWKMAYQAEAKKFQAETLRASDLFAQLAEAKAENETERNAKAFNYQMWGQARERYQQAEADCDTALAQVAKLTAALEGLRREAANLLVWEPELTARQRADTPRGRTVTALGYELKNAEAALAPPPSSTEKV